MPTPALDPRISQELKQARDRGLASGDLWSPDRLGEHMARFRDQFGPAVLNGLDGELLLRRMHGRTEGASKCMAYWLEFKNDDEFACMRFGSIAGGSALKFGIFQRQNGGDWVTGWPQNQQVVTIEDAINIVRKQRDELMAGAAVLAAMDASDTSDEAYARLQSNMMKAAPTLASDGWAHKYWYLIHPDLIDDYHSPRYQRFHLFKLLQMPPDRIGILNGGAPRFNCAGRFITAARELGIPVTTFDRILNQRDGGFHRYWKVGTTEGSTGESHWSKMHDGSYVSIGWPSTVPDLSTLIREDKAVIKNQIRDWLLPSNEGKASVATRKAGEILNFAREMAENDLVLACEGQTVLGVGRIRGSYQYEQKLDFPHKRPVEWLLLDPWKMPDQEGPRTTVYEIGKSPANLLELENRLFGKDKPAIAKASTTQATQQGVALPPLDEVTSRIDSILQRKGQVVLYGPPGTGKTYRAIQAASELASRHAFGKPMSALSASELSAVVDTKGLVRLCTFHPGWGYEDFVEGLRPKTVNGQMIFEPRDGIFKRLCIEAADASNRRFFLVIDEINRGDIPRIFGELITTIEYDKRGWKITLPITESPLVVPKNVFLIGTMNTADRSISLMDAALRRRFGFVELMPNGKLLGNQSVGGLLLGAWLDALNTRLRRNLKRDARNLQIGHAYLMPDPPITSISEFCRVLRDDIIPLLEEYCYEDFNLLKDILGSGLVDPEAGRIREELFGPNREEDLIQALSFEEMEPLVVDQELPEPANVAEEGDEEDADDATSPS